MAPRDNAGTDHRTHGRRPARDDPHRTRHAARGDPLPDRAGAAMTKLGLDQGAIEACHAAASRIAAGVSEEIAGKTTVSVERTIARLLGVDGANDLEVPLPNVLVDHVRDQHELGRGIAYWLGNAMVVERTRSAQQIAEGVEAGELDLCSLPREDDAQIPERVMLDSEQRLGEISARMDGRRVLRERLGESPPPLRY